MRGVAVTYSVMADVESLTLELLRVLRRDIADVRRGQRDLAEGFRDLAEILRRQGQRMDKRFADLDQTISETRNEIELTVKMEVGGRMAGFESRLEARREEVLARMEGTFGTVTDRDKPD